MDKLASITLLGSAIAFLFGVWKYIDARKLEARNKRFEQFRKVFVWFAGRSETGEIYTSVQQAIATYQLAEFPEYKHMSLPIIERLLKVTEHESPPSLFRQALEQVHAKLKS